MNSGGYTPFLITTHSNGAQTVSVMGAPAMMAPLPPLPVVLDSNNMPMPVACPVMPFQPSSSPLMPLQPSSSPLMPLQPSSSPLMPLQPSSSPQVGLPVFLPPSPLLSNTPSGSLLSGGDSFIQLPTYNNMASLSREREFESLEDIQPFESERVQEPAEAVVNENQIPTPTLTGEMTKKELVNTTLDWFYEVLGSEHFDCEGRRGANVLRVKVKTRGALEKVCGFVQRCMAEGLLHHVSCPLSKKKQRRYVRGYLCYLEGISTAATDRMIEIFEEVNSVLVKNCDGELEHPFKGISRNPIPVRSRCNSLDEQHQMAA